MAAVAAAVAFVVAIPIAVTLSGDSTADTAAETSTADVATADVSDESAAATEEFVPEPGETEAAASGLMPTNDDDAMADDASEDEVVEESQDAEDPDGAGVDVTSGDEELADEEVDPALAAPVDIENFTLSDLPTFSTIRLANQAIDDGELVPFYTADQAVIAGVNQECLVAADAVTTPAPYALVTLAPFGGADRLVVIEFADNGATRALDAEDCALLR